MSPPICQLSTNSLVAKSSKSRFRDAIKVVSVGVCSKGCGWLENTLNSVASKAPSSYKNPGLTPLQAYYKASRFTCCLIPISRISCPFSSLIIQICKHSFEVPYPRFRESNFKSLSTLIQQGLHQQKRKSKKIFICRLFTSRPSHQLSSNTRHVALHSLAYPCDLKGKKCLLNRKGRFCVFSYNAILNGQPYKF